MSKTLFHVAGFGRYKVFLKVGTGILHKELLREINRQHFVQCDGNNLQKHLLFYKKCLKDKEDEKRSDF